ncbi:hypothetical protein Aca07nite_27720 [Actinoplanes capillaceus]|uniref:MYXO-CTERM domain-containing protein n=1 Tax=Actinoplanes campanulatus TaxID=113559 RepID=A0ABQ3WGY3_9ACTN|nr:hypothetical protein [Actinoplanes capillaceus]GID45497.1 hypothetical protein Aca07nite_27720 [Actinoplanes capillaceus]
MTTNQITYGDAPESVDSISGNGSADSPSRTRQAVTTARTKATAAGQAARRNPKSTTATVLALAGAAAAAVFLHRRRAAKAAGARGRLASLLHR